MSEGIDLRCAQVAKTHSGMLPQSRTLEGRDHAGPWVRPKVSVAASRQEPVRDIPKGSEPNGSATRPVRAREKQWLYLC